MKDWISVKNETPDDPKYKLVDDIVFVTNDGDIHLGLYANGHWKEWGPNMFETMEWVNVSYPVLYWLPLPKVPEGY